MKPLRADILPADGTALAFPYSYIVPTYPTIQHLVKRFYPTGPVSDIPATGNAPVLLTRRDFDIIVPEWARLVAEIEADDDAVDHLGWVRDMYAWSFAAARVGPKHVLPQPPYNPLLVQPPADRELGEGAILHYTWGPVVHNREGKVVWEFDKRSYGGGQYEGGPRKLTKLPLPPPWEPGLHLQSFFADANAVTESGLALMRLEAETFNAAVDALPELPKGWTDRAAAERAAQPSQEAKDLAAKVQQEVAAKEAAKKARTEAGAGRRRLMLWL